MLDSVLSVLDSGLADLVHVANEVEHLVGEAPLVEGATAHPPLLASLARTSRLPDFTVFSAQFSFRRSFLERCNIVFRCVFALGFAPQTNFVKLRDFIFYLAFDEDFSGKPDEMMEEYLRLEGYGMSSKTIGNYRRKLAVCAPCQLYNIALTTAFSI